MKSIQILTALILALAPVAQAHEKGIKIGPNGGRVLDVEPKAEFFVTPERKVRITFLGADDKAVAKEVSEVSLATGDRANPTTLTFVKDGNSYLSEKPLPEGKSLPVVVKIKATTDAKPATAKFSANLAECGACKHPEYACTCGH